MKRTVGAVRMLWLRALAQFREALGGEGTPSRGKKERETRTDK
jgi:hypothetical protein